MERIDLFVYNTIDEERVLIEASFDLIRDIALHDMGQRLATDKSLSIFLSVLSTIACSRR